MTLATSLAYQTEGFNLRPAVVPTILLDAALGQATLLVNVSYGHGIVDDERLATPVAASHGQKERRDSEHWRVPVPAAGLSSASRLPKAIALARV